jgi:hypothetical protein
MRENLPLGGKQHLEMPANTPYALSRSETDCYPPEEKLASD